MAEQVVELNVNCVVVGTTNPVKIAAVRTVMQRLWPRATVHGVAVASGVSPMPLTDEEAILGARNRAQAALAQMDADFGVGVEGNTVEYEYGMFATAWCVMSTRAGREGLGSSGRILLPNAIAAIVRQGHELGPLIDGITGQHNMKHQEGAVGVFTKGLITREHAMETAVVYALAPFLHPQYWAEHPA